MGVEKLGAEGCALAGGAVVGTLGCATAAVGATGATSAIVTVGAVASSMPVVGSVVGAGNSIGIAAYQIIDGVPIIRDYVYRIKTWRKEARWIMKCAMKHVKWR